MLRRRVVTELLRPTGLSAVGVEGRGSFWEVLVGIEADGLPQGGRERHGGHYLQRNRLVRSRMLSNQEKYTFPYALTTLFPSWRRRRRFFAGRGLGFGRGRMALGAASWARPGTEPTR